MNRKYLPIGTVVRLKKGKKKLMITGFLSSPMDNSEKTYDYCGCFYPEGTLRTDQVYLFNHKQIEVVLFKGYVDEEEKAFKAKLNAWIKTVDLINKDRKNSQ